MRSFVLGAAVATLASASSSDGPRDQWRSEEELGELPLSAVSRLPDKPPRYQMNQSTIIMPCNNSGYMDPERTVGWSIIDFDLRKHCLRGSRCGKVGKPYWVRAQKGEPLLDLIQAVTAKRATSTLKFELTEEG